MLYYLKFSFIKFDHKPILHAKWKIRNFGAYLNLIEWPDFGNEELSKIFNAKVRGSNRLDGVVWIDDSFAPSLFRNSKLGAQERRHFGIFWGRITPTEQFPSRNCKFSNFDNRLFSTINVRNRNIFWVKVIEKHLRILDTASKAAWVGCHQNGKPTHYKNFQNQKRNSLLSNTQPQKTIAET